LLPLIIGGLIILGGFAVIGWLLWQEKQGETPTEPQDQATAVLPPEMQVKPQELLARVGLAEETAQGAQKTFGLFSGIGLLRKRKKENIVATDESADLKTGTASLRLDRVSDTAASGQSEKLFASDTEASLQQDALEMKYRELQERYEKIDALFQEKSESLEKSERNLANEIKNRKEFNKVKDILEKEIRDLKDAHRSAQNSVTSVQTEAQSYQNRIKQLEEKVTNLEKNLLAKEQELESAAAGEKIYQLRINDLQEKLKKTEESIFEKNKKIEDLIHRMKHDFAKSAESSPTTPQESTAEPPKEPLSAAAAVEKESPETKTPQIESAPAGNEQTIPTEPVAAVIEEPPPEQAPSSATSESKDTTKANQEENTPKEPPIISPPEQNESLPESQSKVEGDKTPILTDNSVKTEQLSGPQPLPEIATIPAPAAEQKESIPEAAKEQHNLNEPNKSEPTPEKKKTSKSKAEDGLHLAPDILANQIKEEFEQDQKKQDKDESNPEKTG